MGYGGAGELPGEPEGMWGPSEDCSLACNRLHQAGVPSAGIVGLLARARAVAMGNSAHMY